MGEEEVDSNEIKVVYSENPEVVESQGVHQEEEGELELTASHPGEGILLTNPRSKVTKDELKKLKYLYKFPKSVEVYA